MPDPAPARQRDARVRFVANNIISKEGGRARAAALSPRRRRAIARKGWRVMCAKHFGSDRTAQRRYLAALGTWVYERMAGSFLPGSPLRTSSRHPGPIQDWRSAYYTSDLFTGEYLDIEFMEHLNNV